MDYIVPRGPCRQTSSILSSRCPCLRFMVHPAAAANSFQCDGCGHHASFHELRSNSDEVFRSRWAREDGSFDREAYEADEEVQEILAKRRRLGYTKPMHSTDNLTMPQKAQSTLVDKPRSAFVTEPMWPPEPKKRKAATSARAAHNFEKTFDDLDPA